MILYELNPCPKCGSDGDQIEHGDGARPDDGYRLIICGTCRHETPWARSLWAAVEEWNAQEPFKAIEQKEHDAPRPNT